MNSYDIKSTGPELTTLDYPLIRHSARELAGAPRLAFQ